MGRSELYRIVSIVFLYFFHLILNLPRDIDRMMGPPMPLSSVISNKKAVVIIVIAFVTLAILLTTLKHASHSSPFRGRYYKCEHAYKTFRDGKTELGTDCEYLPRLGDQNKRILLWTTHYGKKQQFNRNIKCGVNRKLTCELVSDKSLLDSSHALIFHGWREDMLSRTYEVNGTNKYEAIGLPRVRYPDQYWVLFMLESPHNYRESMRCYDPLFNWTWNYRTDSDIYMPYGKFQLLDNPLKLSNSSIILPPEKKKKVAWVISNCWNVSSKRLDLVRKLQEYIQIDIYGKCGTLKCPSKDCKPQLGKQYKFYLALENSLCQDYVTEKVFHAYSAGMVPIVYGSANYDLFLPRGSFINVNSFPTAKSLAEYLLFLDRNPEAYMKYFKWKSYVKLQNPSLDYEAGYCKLCEKIHHDYALGMWKVIPNMTDWLFFNQEKGYRICNEPLVW